MGKIKWNWSSRCGVGKLIEFEIMKDKTLQLARNTIKLLFFCQSNEIKSTIKQI